MDAVQSFWMDMETSPKMEFAIAAANRFFVVWTWNMVWIRILPLHPLALAGAQGTRLYEYAQFLYKVFNSGANRNEYQCRRSGLVDRGEL